jgi:transcription initiation factor IIE alpha subunit
MRPPLKFAVLEIIKEKKHATDEELLDQLNKTGSYSINELNKALLDLEILGSITVRSVAKEKRRIEFMEAAPSPVSYRE